MHRALLLAVLSLSVLLSAFTAAHAASYTFTTFDVPGGTISDASGINTAGQIVGHFVDTTNHIHGFLIDGATFTTIDVPGAPRTEAVGINEMGQIVGTFIDTTGNGHGFLKDGATFTTIEGPGATSVGPHGINDTGQIVGTFGDATTTHGFLKDGATFTTIDIPGARGTNAFGINETGQIVGTFADATGYPHGFVATPDEGDTTPPIITVSASPATLSPPNGRQVPVTVSGTITDGTDGSGVQASTYQVMDEYAQIQPSGNVPLVNGVYSFTVTLQASRRGNDQDGRHYTIAVSARDNAGNLGCALATVTVPRN
jgi:probable HAF family extracellular repeat protein